MTRMVLGVFISFLVIFSPLLFGEATVGQKDETVPTIQDQRLVIKIKKDISFKEEIVLSIGPYDGLKDIDLKNGIVISVDFESPAYIAIRGSIYYLLIDYDFYKKLTLEERKYVIAHEIGHAYAQLFRGIAAQKSADIFALRYVRPEVAIGFLDQYCTSKIEYDERVSNIKEFISRQ